MNFSGWWNYFSKADIGTFFYKGKMIIIEVKGFETDVFLIKRKLFRGYLEANKIDCLYFQIYDSLTLQQAIAIIKSL